MSAIYNHHVGQRHNTLPKNLLMFLSTSFKRWYSFKGNISYTADNSNAIVRCMLISIIQLSVRTDVWLCDIRVLRHALVSHLTHVSDVASFIVIHCYNLISTKYMLITLRRFTNFYYLKNRV